MRKAIVGLVLLLTLLLPTTAQAKNRECRFGLGVHAMRQTLTCVVHKLGGVDLGHARYIAYRESHFKAHVINSSSGACGIYQHIQRYWPGRYRAFSHHKRWGREPNRCRSGRTNIIVTIYMVKAGGWGPWS